MSQRGGGTEYHEAVHLISHSAVITVLGWDFDEGLTEAALSLQAYAAHLGKDSFAARSVLSTAVSST